MAARLDAAGYSLMGTAPACACGGRGLLSHFGFTRIFVILQTVEEPRLIALTMRSASAMLAGLFRPASKRHVVAGPWIMHNFRERFYSVRPSL